MNAVLKTIFVVSKIAPRSFAPERAFGFALGLLLMTFSGVLVFALRALTYQPFQWFGLVFTLVFYPMFAWGVSYFASKLLAWIGDDDCARDSRSHQPAA